MQSSRWFFSGRAVILISVAFHTATTIHSQERNPVSDLEIKIAAAQLLTDVGNFEENTQKILQAIRDARSASCQIVLFHEGCLTGYPDRKDLPKIDFDAVRKAERDVRDLAKELGIAVLLGSTGKEGDVFSNYVLVINEHGQVLGQYNKTWRAGEAHYCAGHGPVIFRVAGVEATVIICHDLRYPELTRLAVTAGARIVFIANNESGITAEQKQLGYRSMQISRATENLVYSVMTNCPADPNNVTRRNCSHGNSKIVDPLGNVVDEAGVFEERLVTAVLKMKQATASSATRTIGQNESTTKLYGTEYENRAFAEWLKSGLKLVRRLDGTEVPSHLRGHGTAD